MKVLGITKDNVIKIVGEEAGENTATVVTKAWGFVDALNEKRSTGRNRFCQRRSEWHNYYNS